MKKTKLHIDRQSLKALAHSIRAGISPRDALLYIASSKHGKAKADILAIADMFKLGISYSDAFEKTTLAKHGLFIQIIRISESNGQIAKALDMIVAHMSESSRTKSQILGLSVYPIIVFMMTIAFMLFALLVIVPNIRDIIRMPGVTLNPITSALLIMSDTLIKKSMLVIGVIVTLIISIVLLIRMRFLRLRIESFVLSFPIISQFTASYMFGAYAAFIALYSRFRSDIGTVFELLAETTRMHRIRTEFSRIAAAIGRGETLSFVLQGGSIIPHIWILFASVAERSSSYADMFDHLAEHHAETLDHYSKIYMKMLEPILMIGIGVLVGLLAYGILSPLYGLMQHIK
jgi:type II secretory pathway component PulF